MSYKGTSWKKHKYVKKVGKRYFYAIEQAIEENENEFLNNVKKKKREFDNIVEERSLEFDKSIEGSMRTISEIREKAKNIPEVLKTEHAQNESPSEVKLNPETIQRGKDFFENAYKGLRDLSDTIADNISSGIKSFNKFLSKYF